MLDTWNKRTILLLIIATLISIILIVAFLLPRDNSSTEPTEINHPGTVIINNTVELSDILLPEQYEAVSNSLAKFILRDIDAAIEEAFVTGKITIEPNGNLIFTLSTVKPDKKFTVKVDRTVIERVIITVPEYKFQETVPTYSLETAD